MPRTRRTFTDEFKREAVKLVKQPGAMVTHIARDLGIDQSVLRRWVSQEQGGVMDMRANKPLRSESASEVERLQRELRRVTTERDILKNGHRTRRTAPLKRNTCRPKISRASGSGRQLFGGFEPRQKTWSRGSCGPSCGGAIVRPRLGN